MLKLCFEVMLNINDETNVQCIMCITQLCNAAVNRLVWMRYNVYVVCYVIYVNHIKFELKCSEDVNVN